MGRSSILWLLLCSFLLSGQANSDTPTNTVYFHAWGGSPQINQYLQWVSEEVKQQYNIDLKHVKLSNTSDAVTQVLSQKVSNNNSGTIDLIWLNGENFASMAQYELLLPEWAYHLSNFELTNPDNNPDVVYDFGLPTLGRESPWGRASLVFYYNSTHLEQPPQNLHDILQWAQQQPYRFTYPHVDDFIGISFVKYALLATALKADTENYQALFEPYEAEKFGQVTKPLWTFLDTLHPLMWRKGDFFVKDNGGVKRLFDDEEIVLSLTFSAGEIPSAVDRFELPKTTRSYLMKDGSLSNVHFVTVPFNAPNPEGAKQVADFLLSPIAQARKNKPQVWGDATVLDINKLTQAEKALFTLKQSHPSSVDTSVSSIKLKEPHPSWVLPLKQAWKKRYDTQ